MPKSNLDRLRETPPASGRLFNEAGEVVNIADLVVSIVAVTAGLTFTGDAVKTSPEQMAGERNIKTPNQYAVGVDECNGSILDASTSAQAVSGGLPALIFGVQINTALAGTLTITGLTNVSGAATDVVLPIATPIGYYELKGAKCDTALICTLSDATDDVLVLWRAQ